MPVDGATAMKKVFVDLHLCPPVNDDEKVRALVKRSAELGYKIAGISFPADFNREDLERVRKICYEMGLDLATRVDLTPKNSKELLSTLTKIRRRFEIIAVNCNTREVAIQASKDRRVDILLFALSDPRRHFFSESEARLASEKSAALEINMSQLICSEGIYRVRLLSMLRRDVLLARKFGVPIILSSGASEPHLLRRPEDYAFLSYLIGLDLNSAKRSLSEIPSSIVERNRKKLSPNYVCFGVYVVKRGEDC